MISHSFRPPIQYFKNHFHHLYLKIPQMTFLIPIFRLFTSDPSTHLIPNISTHSQKTLDQLFNNITIKNTEKKFSTHENTSSQQQQQHLHLSFFLSRFSCYSFLLLRVIGLFVIVKIKRR